MPISGEVIEVNTNLDESPELVNSDPYGDGWIVKIRINSVSESNELLSNSDYEQLINKQVIYGD